MSVNQLLKRAQNGHFLTGAEAAEVRSQLLPSRCKEAPLSQVPKDWRKAAKAARKAGFVIWTDGRGHLTFCNPYGETAVVAATGKRNGHSGQNYRIQLRRIGVPLI